MLVRVDPQICVLYRQTLEGLGRTFCASVVTLDLALFTIYCVTVCLCHSQRGGYV